jgi:hypothetical protein
MRLCAASGALATALVDRDGETVDYAGSLSPYEIKVAAAELQIVIALVRRSRGLEVKATEHVIARAARRTFSLIALTDGYALVLVLSRRSFVVSRRGVAEAIRELEREAGLTYASGTRRKYERWARVEVRTARGDPRRPEAIWLEGEWQPLALLGRFRSRDLERREVGYRARLGTGAEFALVREPPGRWFVEDL